MIEDHIFVALKRAAGDLLYPSETDAPFHPFVGDRADNTPVAARRLTGQSATAPCQEVSLDDFLADLMEEKAFSDLRAALEAILREVKVYRIGSIEVTYAILGTADDGRLAGLRTTAVET